MEIFPAIDVLDGKAVRLHKGSYAHVTVYADDPATVARDFHQQGATTLHVVDLDGAREGRPVNVEIVERILAAAPIDVEVGGGIRSADTARAWLRAGARRVVIGTSAIKDPGWVRALAKEAPSSVVVAIDARGGEVAVEGWLEGTGRAADEVAREVDAWSPPPWGILYTNIDRDGTREGPDVEGTAALQRSVGCLVIASGGIGKTADLVALQDAGVRASVVGRALYSGAFTYREACAALLVGAQERAQKDGPQT